ncbi:VOC family protein [Bacillus horti]|uniref:VOC family protein n=1 Tax=Caldalkalibacillus horti TaxID=77523 RepID=A0ABT9W2P1_9BACI|nr:VOC family protein [Bacillus horti]MDQ0167517.1 hypothetical protein [Bacillus horti]
MAEGQRWYEILLNRRPDFIPHEGVAEWELIPGCWLQVAEGIPSEGNGPLRIGVTDLKAEKDRLLKELEIDDFDIHSRSEVPVMWGTFADPWGNRIRLFEHVDKDEERKRIETILGELIFDR